MRTTLSFALLAVALLPVVFADNALHLACGLLLMIAGMVLMPPPDRGKIDRKENNGSDFSNND